MTTHFLRSYSLLCINTCHRRGAFAMGGMAAQIPIKNDPASQRACARAKCAPTRSGRPPTATTERGWRTRRLVPIAREIFDRLMPTPNQVTRLRPDVNVTAADLLQIPPGQITDEGLRNNVSVSLAVHGGMAVGQRLRARSTT